MEEVRLVPIDVDAARDAQQKVRGLKDQAELLINRIVEECANVQTRSTLALFTNKRDEGFGLDLISPFGEGRLHFEPRISDTGAYGYYEVRKKRFDAKDEVYWPVVATFSLSRDNVIFNSEGGAVVNVGSGQRGQIFMFVLGLAATLGL